MNSVRNRNLRDRLSLAALRGFSLLFPLYCPLCGRKSGEDSDFFREGICPGCRQSLPWPGEGEHCRFCGRPLESGGQVCRECDGREWHYDEGFSLYPYRDLPRELLYQYKMKNTRQLAFFFARELQETFLAERPGIPVVPVPVLRSNLKKRGWDPVRQVAVCLRKIYSRPMLILLRRLPSASQKTLSRRDRLENMKGRIRPRKTGPFPGEVVLLDDVRTTGATADECARVLKEGGCRRVTVLTLFRD